MNSKQLKVSLGRTFYILAGVVLTIGALVVVAAKSRTEAVGNNAVVNICGLQADIYGVMGGLESPCEVARNDPANPNEGPTCWTNDGKTEGWCKDVNLVGDPDTFIDVFACDRRGDQEGDWAKCDGSNGGYPIANINDHSTISTNTYRGNHCKVQFDVYKDWGAGRQLINFLVYRDAGNCSQLIPTNTPTPIPPTATPTLVPPTPTPTSQPLSCTSFESVYFNSFDYGRTYGVCSPASTYTTFPRSLACQTNSLDTFLVSNVAGATQMSFYTPNPISEDQVTCASFPVSSYGNTQAYAPNMIWTVALGRNGPVNDPGKKRVCVRYTNATSAVQCGAAIELLAAVSTPTPTVTPTPTGSPTPTPTATPTPTPTGSPTPTPTGTIVPTVTPTITMTPTPTVTATPAPAERNSCGVSTYNCGSNANCKWEDGYYCYIPAPDTRPYDGYCRKTACPLDSTCSCQVLGAVAPTYAPVAPSAPKTGATDSVWGALIMMAISGAGWKVFRLARSYWV